MLMMLTLLACSDPPPPPPKPTVKPPPAEPEPEPEPEVRNDPPKISAFSLTPDAPTTDTALQAKVTAKDPEGDRVDVDYEWMLNGKVLLLSLIHI